MGNSSAGPARTGHRAWLYEQLAGSVATLIEQGTLRPGERIPSVRELSRQHNVSVSTVLQAYYLLEDRGLIEARPQSGYYVRATLRGALPEPDISSPRSDPTEVSVRELVMMVLRDLHNPNLVQLGAATPNPDLLPTKKLNAILMSIVREGGERATQYDIPPGLEALRVQVAKRAVLGGCQLAPDDIVTTSGCIEAVALALRATCRPGDTVAIESPIYFGMLQVLEMLDLRGLEIPTHPRTGISLEALQFAVEHSPVRACLVLSNFNNPLGSCIPDDNKRELVQILGRRDIPLIENDILGEFYHGEHRPAVAKAYDRKGLVLLCSSFSKDLAPGYRVGWLAPGRFRPTVEWLKYTWNIATPTLSQLTIAQFLAGGGYDAHLRRIRRAYARYVTEMSQAVERYFPAETRVTRPAGGYVLWVQLPERVDSLELYRRALQAGITLTPGHIFSAKGQYRNFIRLNAAFWSGVAERAVARLGEMIAELAGGRLA